MNTNGLAKLYPNLTPQERHALIVQAALRGDDREQERLTRSAPTQLYRLPDYHGQAEALQLLVLFHVGEVLELAVLYWRSVSVLAAVHGEPQDRAASERLLGIVRMNAYTLCLHCEAWRQLGQELHIDVETLARDIPSFRAVTLTEASAQSVAFSEADAREWLLATDGADEAPATVAGLVRGMRDFLDQWAEKWG